MFILVALVGTLPSLSAESATTTKAVHITNVGDLPFVLDDQGNLWSTSVAPRAYFMNLLPFRSHMAKVENTDRITNMAEGLVVKDDGTVWTAEYVDSSSKQDQDKWGKRKPILKKQIPHLQNIVKVSRVSTGILALDRDGKLWAVETLPRLVQEGPLFVEYPPLYPEPVLVQGIDHIKDLGGYMILKEDGTLWTWECGLEACASVLNQIRTSPPVRFRELEDVAKFNGDYDNGIALKKDGTVWIWGYAMLAKPKEEKWPKYEIPFQLTGFSDITDISYNNAHILALKKDGTVWAMGYFLKSGGSVAIYDKENFQPLHQVEGITDVAKVFASEKTYAAIKNDGSFWMWGSDLNGLFGIIYGGYGAIQERPVQVALKPIE